MKTRIGEKNPFYGKKHTEETKNKNRIATIKRNSISNNRKFHNTSIEKKIKKYLDYLNIKVRHGYPIIDILHRYCCDFYLPKKKIIIEADGDHWHNYPYGKEIDKLRNKELQIAGYTVLRFWECEINNNFEKVKRTIKKVINNG